MYTSIFCRFYLEEEGRVGIQGMESLTFRGVNCAALFWCEWSHVFLAGLLGHGSFLSKAFIFLLHFPAQGLLCWGGISFIIVFCLMKAFVPLYSMISHPVSQITLVLKALSCIFNPRNQRQIAIYVS